MNRPKISLQPERVGVKPHIAPRGSTTLLGRLRSLGGTVRAAVFGITAVTAAGCGSSNTPDININFGCGMPGVPCADAGPPPSDAGPPPDTAPPQDTAPPSPTGCPPGTDPDSDWICNPNDRCPLLAETTRCRSNGVTPSSPGEIQYSCDLDNDGLCDQGDPCPTTPPLPGQSANADGDGDGVGDRCDNAPSNYNPGQEDTDGDGRPDVIDTCEAPNPVSIDRDGDGSEVPCDCDDSDPSVHPGSFDQACDGVDRDCDGTGEFLFVGPDGSVLINGEPMCTCLPGTIRETGTDVGVCERGEDECLMNTPFSSSFHTTRMPVGATTEICDSVDNDCDGSTDEGLASCACPTVGATRPCGTDVGACAVGAQTCQADHSWSACAGGTGPQAETCNGEDDDCDGSTDEGFRVGDSCTGRGACATGGSGRLECDGPNATICDVNPGGSRDRSSEEVCDNVDNDCDGTVDEGTFTGGQAGASCNEPGVCGAGVNVCVGPRAVDCSSLSRAARNPALLESADPPLCNGVDDDCDGVVDDGCACASGASRTCGTDVGACIAGTQSCIAGVWESGCHTSAGSTQETCDGVDNDCDGDTDEGFRPAVGTPCTPPGICATGGAGVRECNAAGTGTVCSTGPGGSASRVNPEGELCNTTDDDCDGVVNEDFTLPGGFRVGDICDLPGGGHCAVGQESRVRCTDPHHSACACGPTTP